MDSYALSDVGISREINQDAVFAQETRVGNLENLFIVADGMGGHKAGEYASAYAVKRLVELVSSSEETNPKNIFEWAFPIINQEVYNLGVSDESLSGMGTTLVACTIDSEHRLTVANVGDSRLYVYNAFYGLRQITRDHSFVEELVRKGQITRGSALYNQSKNIITRAIGAANGVKTDVFQIEIEEGDTILLCSDGLSNMIPDTIISLYLAIPDTAECKAKTFIQEANSAGGYDNISAVVICTEDSENLEDFSEEQDDADNEEW